MKIFKLMTLALASIAMALLLSGCPTFEVGGWIDSIEEGNNGKATFGGSFSCTELSGGLWLEGTFQYHDHDETITWRGKNRDLSFHGDLAVFNPIFDSCEDADEAFMFIFGSPDGYCGPARLQPAPKKEGDTGYGYGFSYRIGVVDDEDDELYVWLGPDLLDNEFGCPLNVWDDTIYGGEYEGYYWYHNHGTLGGGSVTIYEPLTLD